MTETEAKEKWCPMTHQVKFPTENSETLGVNCIASDCMMWRESNTDNFNLGKEIHGYCGLAGKP